MKTTWIYALIVTTSLTACSKKQSGVTGGPTPLSGGSGSSRVYRDGYQLELNGCSTGKQTVQAASLGEARAKLCTALQDDELNHSCAESLRRDYFNKVCEGQAWTPVYAENRRPRPSPTEPTDTGTGFDYRTREKIYRALEHVLIDRYELAPSLSESQRQAATQLSEDALSCGLSTLGPKCLDSVAVRARVAEVARYKGENVLFAELKIRGTQTPVIFVTPIARVEPAVKIGAIEVYQMLKSRETSGIEQYLNGDNNLALLTTFTPSADFEATAGLRAARPRDLRQLYHATMAVLAYAGSDPAARVVAHTRLIKNLVAQRSLIAGSADPRYPSAVLDVLTGTLQASDSELAPLYESLLGCRQESLRLFASASLLDLQPSRVELKPATLKALHDDRWDVRRKAVSALSKAPKSEADENALLGRIDDADDEVRKAATDAAAKFSVTESNLGAITALSRSDNWEARREAAKLLSRVDTAKSVRALIGMMDDADDEVRVVVTTQLRSKTLPESQVGEIAARMSSDNWEVRRNAAQLLGKIGADAATLVLIDKLDDSDDEVRAKITQLLQARTLPASAVGPLKARFASDNWETRRDVAKLLGKIRVPASRSALEDQLARESDDEVKAAIAAALKAVRP